MADDLHRAVEHDDRGVDVLEQRLQPVALVAQIVLLPADRLRHVAERRHEQAEVGVGGDAEIDVEIAARDGARAADQRLHRPRHAARGDGYATAIAASTMKISSM